jgi:hypothetical protein
MVGRADDPLLVAERADDPLLVAERAAGAS